MSNSTPTIYDVLDEIRDRPAMYMGTKSIASLSAFISGMSWAAERLGVSFAPERPSFGPFHDFAARHYGRRESTAGWMTIILQGSGNDESDSVDQFYTLLDEYRRDAPSLSMSFAWWLHFRERTRFQKFFAHQVPPRRPPELRIALEHSLPEHGSPEYGQAIPRFETSLADIAGQLGIPHLFTFASLSARDAIEFAQEQHVSELDVPPEQWFESQDGLSVVSRMREHVEQDPHADLGDGKVLDDLRAYERILALAVEKRIRWHLELR